jgi:hypothetical protein
LKVRAAAEGLPFFGISSVTNRGTKELIAAIAARLDQLATSEKPGVIELAS